jgi:hypothetical protein
MLRLFSTRARHYKHLRLDKDDAPPRISNLDANIDSTEQNIAKDFKLLSRTTLTSNTNKTIYE